MCEDNTKVDEAAAAGTLRPHHALYLGLGGGTMAELEVYNPVGDGREKV